MYTQNHLNHQLRKLDLTIIPRNFVTDISRLSYYPVTILSCSTVQNCSATKAFLIQI
jgi:hypothetical protein